MTKTNKQLAAHLYESAEFRIDNLIWLAAACADEHGRMLDDFCMDFNQNEICQIFDLPEDADADIGFEADELVEFLAMKGKFGFLAQLLIPVKEYYATDRCQWSYGCCHSEQVYAETLEELISKGDALAKEWAEKDRQKSLQKQTPEPA